MVGIQDLGGAGLTCASSETRRRGGVGMDFDVGAVPRREHGMEPFEVMTSESQERMLAIVTPEAARRGAPAVRTMGGRGDRRRAGHRPTGPEGGRLRILDGFDGEVLADVPASSLHDAAPLYDRPRAEPAGRSRRAAEDPGTPAPGLVSATFCSTCCATPHGSRRSTTTNSS